MLADPRQPDPGRVRGAAALAVPGTVALAVPLFGFLATVSLPFIVSRFGPELWPQTSRRAQRLCAALAIAGLWLPAMLALASLGKLGSEATTWLLLPLCAPTGASLVVPALFAAATYLAGTTATVIIRRPWPWVIGAWAAPLAYSAASRWLVDFICFS